MEFCENCLEDAVVFVSASLDRPSALYVGVVPAICVETNIGAKWSLSSNCCQRERERERERVCVANVVYQMSMRD